MGTVLNLTGATVLEEKSSSFDPLPAGTYAVDIYDVKSDVVAAGKRNAGKTVYNVQFRIRDGQVGANRRHFERIMNWGVWEEFGDKAESDNFSFFNFLGAVQNRPAKDVRTDYKAAIAGEGEFTIPTPTELMGKKVLITLDIKPWKYGFEKAVKEDALDGRTEADFKQNTLKKIAPFKEQVAAKPSLAASGFTL